MDMMGLIALRFEEKEAHRVVVGVLGVFVRLLPRWVGFVDVQPFFLSPQTQNPVQVFLRFFHERPDGCFRSAFPYKVSQVVHRAVGFVEIQLPTRAERAVPVRKRVLFHDKTGSPVALVRHRYRSSKPRNAGTRHYDVVLSVPFLIGRSRIGFPAGAPRKTESGSPGQSQTCPLQEIAARCLGSLLILIRHRVFPLHASSLSASIASLPKPAPRQTARLASATCRFHFYPSSRARSSDKLSERG